MEHCTELFHTELCQFNLEKRRTQGTWSSPYPIGRGKGEKQEQIQVWEPQGTVWAPCWMPPRQGF